MTASIMDSVRGMLTSETLGKAADFAGESPETTRRVAQGAVPTIFAGLAQGASTPKGATLLFGALREGGGGGPAGQLVSKIFGDRAGAVGDALGQSSGVSGRSATRVLTFLMPLVAGVLGKHITSNRLDPRGLSSLLSSQKKAVLDDPNTPRGLSGALGLSSISELGGATTAVTEPYVSSARAPEVGNTATRATEEVAERAPQMRPHHVRAGEVKKQSPWLAGLSALAVGVLVLAGIFGLAHRSPRLGVTAPQPNEPAAPQAHMPQIQAPVPNAGPVTLPGGKTLDVAPDSAVADMAHTLGDKSKTLPQTFQFSDLTFESGSATPTPSSTKTVDDVAMILEAYPSAHIRVAGHADNAGDPTGNRVLSQSRAASIKNMLVERGVAADRIETVGMGEHVPTASNESDQGRAQNRRADIELLTR